MGNRLCLTALLLLLGSTNVLAAAGRRPAPRPSTPPLFLLIDFPYQMWSNAGTKIHLVAFTPRMRPARRAEVWLGKRRLGLTDAHGTFIFDFKARKGWRGGKLRVRKRLGGVVHEGRIAFSAYRRTSSYAHQRAYLYTDRGIYRPGGTLRARVLAYELRDRYHPLGSQKAVLTLRSPWGEVARQEIRLDAFGTGHATLPLKDLEPVRHTLTVRVGRARHSRTVKLAHFKRPALEIRHGFPSWFTARSPHIVSSVRLMDLHGKSPQGGTLVVEALAGKRMLAKRAFKLDGRASYGTLFPRADVARFSRAVPVNKSLVLRIHARCKDGTTATLRRDLRRLVHPYTAVIELDRDDYRGGARVTALVKMTDPDDLPVRGRRVALHVGKSGRRQHAYTSAQGTAVFRFNAPKRPGKNVRLQAFTSDVKGPLASATFAVRDTGAMESRLGRAQVVQNRWVPVSVTLSPGFTPLEQVLHCDVTDHSGAIVAAFKLRWGRTAGKWVARGRFKAPSWGSMLLTMFGLGARDKNLRRLRRQRKPMGPEVAGILMDGQQVTVHPDQALRLQLSGVPRQAKPGARMRVGLTVRGPNGALVDARVGAALVDSNILALGDPLQDIPPVPYFYNPRLRVMSTTGSKILTWPVVARTWTCHSYDIALPPFTFAEGGPAKCEGGLGLGGGGAGGGGAGGFGMGGPPPRFTLRQRFEATSYWAPALLARRGRLNQGIRLPDAISRQTLLLVASDKRGRMGVLRRTITVFKKLSIQLDLPPAMTAGDEVEFVALARNHTKRSLRLQLALKGRGVTVLSAPHQLTVPPGGPVPFRVRLRAERVGKASLEVRGWRGNVHDGLRRVITVLPSGPPVRRTLNARARRTQPARFILRRAAADQALTASLHLDYPNVLPALATVQHALRHPSLGGDSMASTLQTAALVLRHAQRFGLPGHRRRHLRGVLERGIHQLLRHQLRSGAFAYWRLNHADAYHTAYVLETLLDIRDAGIRVPEKSLRRAAWYLLSHRAADGLWDVSQLAFWEGRNRDVRTGLSAEIFRAVARASSLKCKHRPNTRLVAVARTMEALVRTQSRDPRTLGAALEGLVALYRRCDPRPPRHRRPRRTGRFRFRAVGHPKILLSKPRRALLDLGAQRLIRLQRRGHWEPSWFSAWGGNLEANAAALRTLHRLDRRRHRAAIRAAFEYLVARRSSWGEWHNERGTAAALRALLEVADTARAETKGARVEVWVNGKRIRALALHQGDPWASAARLSRVRLTDHLRTGVNRVEVRYTGALVVPVRVHSQRWRARGTKPSPPPRATPRVTLHAPHRVAVGARFRATLTLHGKARGRGVRVAVTLPATVSLDRPAMRALTTRNPGLRISQRGRVLYAERVHRPGARNRIHLALRAERRGRSAFARPTAAGIRRPRPTPSPLLRPLTVY